MTNPADETKINQTLDRQAIQAALQGRWEEAIDINKEISAQNPENTSAMNRLGIAYLKTKQLQNARKTFKKVLEIDPFNSIAKSNLKKATPKFLADNQESTPLSNHTYSFIEESGKSKVMPVRNVGEPNVLANLYTGLEVNLKPAARKIKVTTTSGQYIGSLPDDISVHLFKLLKAGNKYQAVIKSADAGNIQVFVKELKRTKRLSDVPSFSASNLDDAEGGPGVRISQPPLEIYDQLEEEGD